MTTNITKQAQNFFGDAQVRDDALQSLSGYMYIGFFLFFLLFKSTALLCFSACNEIAHKIKYPGRPRTPDASFWGALVGYFSGAVLGYAALGHLKEKNDLIYKQEYPRAVGSSLNGSLQLRDPGVAINVMDAFANLTVITTCLGAGVATCIAETCFPDVNARLRSSSLEQNIVVQNYQDSNEEGVEMLSSDPELGRVEQTIVPRLNS